MHKRDGRWCIVDLKGKHGRVRTAPMPAWVKAAVDGWTAAACLTDGYVFRRVNRADRVSGERLGEKAVWQMLKQYAEAVGVPGIAPHDLRMQSQADARAEGVVFQANHVFTSKQESLKPFLLRYSSRLG